MVESSAVEEDGGGQGGDGGEGENQESPAAPVPSTDQVGDFYAAKCVGRNDAC